MVKMPEYSKSNVETRVGGRALKQAYGRKL